MVPTSAEPIAAGTFGSGAREPYDHALRDPARQLYLREAGSEPSADVVRLEIERFLAGADDGDAAVLDDATGPVLDIGCGPGRMVHAAIMAGHMTLGIDISTTAVRLAQEHGLPVLRRSVFQDLPAEGDWGTALLIDGNVGIGGDPRALLARCRDLVREVDGRIFVETHPVPSHDRVFSGVVVDDLERESLPFPWAEVGAVALRRYANSAGLHPVREWMSHGRPFTELGRS
ncbi:MAG: methyltransferase domain-containing protein [Pseudolysinimonas sp.]